MPLSPNLPLLVRLAFLWNRIGPRGRGFVPRHVGKLFGPDDDYIIRTAHGARLRMDMANLEVYAPIYNAQGSWEPHVAATCTRMLRPGEVFFDIGANAGMVTLETCALLGHAVSIYAFEPQPTLARSLRRSVELNSFQNVTVVECLLGDREGAGELYLTSHAIHASIIPRESHYQKISLPLHKIDTLVSNGTCKPPHVVKIDTEGSEMSILHGMEQTLRSSAPSLVFEADENMKRFGYSGDDLVAYLKTLHAYEMYSILPGSGELTPWKAGATSDVLAIAPHHRVRLQQ